MAILSIQSQVAAGYVGNSAAVFALQRLGREVLSIPTTQLSHHPGHGGSLGSPTSARLQTELLNGLTGRGRLADCEAILSGYLGRASTAKLVLDAVSRVKTANPRAVYLCDPVLGDDGRLYVRQNVVREMHNLAAKADIITPNAFELGVLSGEVLSGESKTREAALRAMRVVGGMSGDHGKPALASKIVVLTSFTGTDTPAGTLDMMAVDRAAAWRLSVPMLARKFYGAGDLFAAIFLDAWLPARDTAFALGQAASALQGVLALTAERCADELSLIGAQNLLGAPRQLFIPELIS